MYVRVQEKTAFMYENIDKIYYYCKIFKTCKSYVITTMCKHRH